MRIPCLMKNYEIVSIGEVYNLELVTCQFANITDKLLYFVRRTSKDVL